MADIKIGDRFIVTEDHLVFSKGSIVELYCDDGSPSPVFKLIKGDCVFILRDGSPGGYCNYRFLKPYSRAGKSKEDMLEQARKELDEALQKYITLLQQ